MASSFRKIITKRKISQVAKRISYKGDDLLACDIKPDKRPFKWPTRRRPPTRDEIEQPMLFNHQIEMPRGTCDECRKEILGYSYTSLTLWNEVAEHRERICPDCFTKLHTRKINDWL
jgi:hypothetical protein